MIPPTRIWLNQNSPKKCCYSWWLLGMIPFSINQFQTHRHSMKNTSRIHLKIQKKQKKNPKTSICSNKKTNGLPSQGDPQFKGPSICSAQPTPGRSKPSDPGEVLSSAVPFGLAMEDHHHVSPMFVAELSLFLLIKTCSVDGKSFLDDKKTNVINNPQYRQKWSKHSHAQY